MLASRSKRDQSRTVSLGSCVRVGVERRFGVPSGAGSTACDIRLCARTQLIPLFYLSINPSTGVWSLILLSWPFEAFGTSRPVYLHLMPILLGVCICGCVAPQSMWSSPTTFSTVIRRQLYGNRRNAAYGLLSPRTELGGPCGHPPRSSGALPTHGG
jgi:hypothetical protein